MQLLFIYHLPNQSKCHLNIWLNIYMYMHTYMYIIKNVLPIKDILKHSHPVALTIALKFCKDSSKATRQNGIR